MGRLIINGLLHNKNFSKSDFKIVVSSENSFTSYQQENFIVSKEWNSLQDCEIVFLALRPDVIKSLTSKFSSIFIKKQIIISVAAGFSLAALRKIFSNALVTRIRWQKSKSISTWNF